MPFARRACWFLWRAFCGVLSLCSLTSCLFVEDFGTYWNKATIDPALLAEWRIDEKETVRIESAGDTMRIEEATPKEPSERAFVVARALQIGAYHYLMVKGKPEGSAELQNLGLFRYLVTNDTLTVYWLHPERMNDFLVKNYSSVGNITVPPCIGKCRHPTWTTIRLLDDEVYDILAKIPATEEFWGHDGSMKKITQK
ncbi:MAG TPA: hypothetical protein VEF76_06315 [Patescibacteria group bacterium]|nr:hypothetical protein [Patescibacteria group bacterium]